MRQQRPAVWWSVALVLALVCAAASVAAQRRSKPETHTVTIDATSFTPANLTIRAGDTVIWVNKDVLPHTATESAKKGFDSGMLATGASWKRTFAAKGDVNYVCAYHPTMKGRVRVK